MISRRSSHARKRKSPFVALNIQLKRNRDNFYRYTNVFKLRDMIKYRHDKIKSYLNEPSMTLAEASYYYTGFAGHLLNVMLKITMLRRNIFVH